MSWQDRIASDKWRLVARKGGKIVHEITTRDERAARYAFAGLFAANSKANEDGKGYDNIELQVRYIGVNRYHPVLQAVGSKILEW